MNTAEEVYMKLHVQDADASKKLHNSKWRRAREQGNITRFVTEVGSLQIPQHVKTVCTILTDSVRPWDG